MALRRPPIRSVVAAATAAIVFGLVFLLRFNDPGGSFAGLTDDHFFYLIRSWQILFGDLPVRDFVDHGAPLYYYVGAAVQTIGGRGTLSEIAFSSAMLALSAALICWLCARASGWIVLGLVGALFFVCLEPRYYNYPKFLSYAVAIPLLWRFADAPNDRSRLWLAVVTVLAFLFRHDHGVFIAASMAALLVLMRELSWGQRLKHFAVYGALTAVMLTPYLLFIQANGGIGTYFEQASAWAARDRDRAPVVFPGLFDNPDGVSEETERATAVGKVVGRLRDNWVAFTAYTEVALPFFALFVIWASSDGGRPGWPQARAKLAMVAILGVMLVGFFLRSPLAARLADPSVPLAILVTWLIVAVPRMLVSRAALSPAAQSRALPVRAAIGIGAAVIAFALGAGLSRDFYDRLDRSSMVERVGKPFERAGQIAGQMRREWNLDTWAERTDTSDLITLARYVNSCTAPTDRVLVQAYLPQVLALAQRAFAGGHADLRPGFFTTDEAQRLTLARLKAQSVPLILLDTGQSYENFRSSFPLVTAHIDREYELAGTREFDGRFEINLFVRKDRAPAGPWEPLGWPCYAGEASRGVGSVTAPSGRPRQRSLSFFLAPLRGAGRLEGRAFVKLRVQPAPSRHETPGN